MGERKGVLVVTYDELREVLGLQDFDIQWVKNDDRTDSVHIMIKGDYYPYEHESGWTYCHTKPTDLEYHIKREKYREILFRKFN